MVHTLPPASTIRDRLFRPYRWRLWVQFALLGAVVLFVPLVFTAQRLLDSGREVLIEHETIDLSDESNLRVNEFREDMGYLAGDLRRGVDAAGRVADTLESIRAKVAEVSGESVREVRRRFMTGAVVGVYAVDRESGAVLEGATDRGPDVLAALADAHARRTRKVEPFGWSGLHSHAGRVVQAYAFARGDGPIYALVIDFSRYVANRQKISPRHLYVVTDPTGRVLIHPDPAVTAARPPLPELVAWNYPEFAGHNWFAVAPLSAAEREKRMAVAVRNGGARLAAVPAPKLACYYRKGYFGNGQELSKQLGDRAAEVAQAFNQVVAAEIANDPLLRVGETTARSGYVELAHADRAALLAASDRLTAWWKGNTGGAIDWNRPIACPTMQGQLTPLRIDLNDDDDPAWLVVAASPDELKQDIDDRFNDIFLRWVLPTLVVTGLLGIALVMTLTHSVNRLAVAAAELETDDSKPLPLGGPYEVSQLARTLQTLVFQVQDRDRQLRDRAARYETILRAAGEGVLITNAGGVIEEANKAAGRMFGSSPDALIGRPVTELVTNPMAIPPATDSDTSTSLVPGSRTLDAVKGRRSDGSAFWLELNLKPVPLRDRVVVVCILRDITLRREAEERVRKLNDELEMRVKQRTAELEEANTKLEVALRQAEAAARAKDTFVATMSHELRQPLHIIIGFTEALKEEAADLGVESIEPDLNKILSAARLLLELINDVLDMAKISAGKMELTVERFPLAEMVGEVKTLVAPLAAKNANTFSVDAPPDLGEMTADERRVRQVLINLLSNAFKFTNAGRVDLRVRRVTEQGREWIRFRVADTGRGMTADQVSRLFQRFYQADSSTTRGAGGTGLGLAITQSFTELMGGQPIRVTSQEGVGTEFVITLPAVIESVSPPRLPPPPPPVLPAADTTPAPPAAGRTVLVVDDDPMVRELMDRFLRKEGFRVLLAAAGDEGLKLAREQHPCLITLDVAMPGADGWTVLAQLKDDPTTADIPVVMLTIVDDRGRGFALGATEYLTKPIDWQRLGAILRRYLVGRADGVLVIDDDPDNRLIVRRHLERDGWAVREADNGERGLAAFAENRPGLILLDLMMPVLDGFGFLDELNRRHPGHRVPVVVLTAKELTPGDFDRLNGRVARILEKGDLNHLEALLELIRRTAKG